MSVSRETLICYYQYDALNRLVANTLSMQATTQIFYMKDRLVTEIQGAEQRSIMQHEDQLLAQQQSQSGTVETRLLATDQQRSVLNVLDANRMHPSPTHLTAIEQRRTVCSACSVSMVNGRIR